jgi:hypothetical protein
MPPELGSKLQDALEVAEKLAGNARDAGHRDNLRWFQSTLLFTLLLDRVSAAIEPAYRLKEESQHAGVAAPLVAESRRVLESAPIEALFRTYAGRVRSTGELGVLSSLNQRLWLQYAELKQFLATFESEAKRRPSRVSRKPK